MNPPVLYSIVVPVYNVEQYLRRCVDSLIQQTYAGIEILLVDDGSTDQSPSICDQYAAADDRISVFHKKNGGLSDARNFGIDHAKGEYILFVDSDDWIEPNTIASFHAFVRENPDVDLFIGCLKNTDGTLCASNQKAVVGQKYSGADYYVRFQKSVLKSAVAPLYKKSFLDHCELRFLVGRLHEDIEFTPRAYMSAGYVIYTDLVFYNRFVRAESITTAPDKRRNLVDLIFICKRLSEYARDLHNRKAERVMKDTLCSSYLSLFYEANVFAFRLNDYSPYIDKKLVRQLGKSLKNRLKAGIFVISPKLYCLIRKLLKGGPR